MIQSGARHRFVANILEMEERDNWNEKGGRIMAGIFLLAIGALAIARKLIPDFPEWIFTWQMLLIGIGIFVGLRHGFRGLGWLMPIAIGSIFLIDELMPDLNLRPFSWPMLFIGIGLLMIFGNFNHRRRRWDHGKWGRDARFNWDSGSQKDLNTGGEAAPNATAENYSQDDYVNSTAVFGGVHKVLVSKNFKGGKATNIFGGTELNLSQSDFTGEVTLTLEQVFGGTKLTVPPTWQIKSEMVAIFGGIEDKRVTQLLKPDPTKILVIKGTTIFGGLEINNY